MTKSIGIDEAASLGHATPREDEGPRRPLPYDEDLERKPAHRALRRELHQAPMRRPLWPLRRS